MDTKPEKLTREACHGTGWTSSILIAECRKNFSEKSHYYKKINTLVDRLHKKLLSVTQEVRLAKTEVERWDAECRVRGEPQEEPLWFTEAEIEAKLEAESLRNSIMCKWMFNQPACFPLQHLSNDQNMFTIQLSSSQQLNKNNKVSSTELT